MGYIRGDAAIPIPRVPYTIKNSVITSCDRNVTQVDIFGFLAKKIGDKAFSQCGNLQSITIRGSIEEIGNEAFANCTLLRAIMFTGTPEEWYAIKKGMDWNKNVPMSQVIITMSKPVLIIPCEKPSFSNLTFEDALADL